MKKDNQTINAIAEKWAHKKGTIKDGTRKSGCCSYIFHHACWACVLFFLSGSFSHLSNEVINLELVHWVKKSPACLFFIFARPKFFWPNLEFSSTPRNFSYSNIPCKQPDFTLIIIWKCKYTYQLKLFHLNYKQSWKILVVQVKNLLSSRDYLSQSLLCIFHERTQP